MTVSGFVPNQILLAVTESAAQGMDQDVLIGLLLIAALACGVLGIVFFPAMVAFGRGHTYRWPILVITTFFGWTLIGWVAALVWAVMPQGQYRGGSR